jgi:hypothetical protein
MALVATAQVTSNIDRMAMAIVGIMPPLALWFWWNEPAQTMSESIHAVRNEGRSARRQTLYNGGLSREEESHVHIR